MNPPNDIKASKRPDPEHLDGRDSKGSHKQDVRVAHSNHSDRPSNHNMEPRMDSGVSLLSGNVSAPAASSTTKLAVKPKFDIIQTLKIDIASKLKFILNPRSVAVANQPHHPPQKSMTPTVGEDNTVLDNVEGPTISGVVLSKMRNKLRGLSDLSKLVLMQHLVANGNVWIDVYDIIQGKVSGEQRNVKSAQVELMGEVYFYADLVLWVTTARDDQTLALLEDADADNIQSWAQKESCRILSWSPPRDGGAFEHWTRAWTYQEIALAKELHAVSPYTGRDWKMRLMLKKIRNIWTKVGKESRDHELEELKQLRRMIMGALNDLELVSQARSHNHVSGMNNKRLIRELGTSRISTRAKDILFTHLWILGIPKGLLVYSESVEWNIRQFCAHLISRGQLTIGANNAAPVGVENACWIPPVLFKLLDDDANKREGDTSILKLVKLRPEDRIIPTRVLDDGRLELKTMVKQLHGDVWIAFLNGRESVVFLKSTSHTVVVTDSNWTGGQLETVSFGTTQPESFELDTTVANNVTDPPKVYYRHTD